MAMRDWLTRYPWVAALLQQGTDVLEGASVEAEAPGAGAVSCMECAAAPPYPVDATAYLAHCLATGHAMRAGTWRVCAPMVMTGDLGRTLSGEAGTTVQYTGTGTALMLRIGERTRQARRHRRR